MYEYSLKKVEHCRINVIPPNIPDPSEYFDKMLEIKKN